MSLQNATNPGQTITIKSAGAITKHRFVGYTNQLCAADAKARGVSGEFNNDNGTFTSVTISGVVEVETGGTFSVGAKITSGASGVAVVSDNAADAINGYAVTASTASGQLVLIQLV